MKSNITQTTAIGTVAKSLPQNKVILLTHLISNSYIPYTDLLEKNDTINYQTSPLPFSLIKLTLIAYTLLLLSICSELIVIISYAAPERQTI